MAISRRDPCFEEFDRMSGTESRWIACRYWDPFNTMFDIDQGRNLLGDHEPSEIRDSQALQAESGGQVGFPNSSFSFLNSMALDVHENDKNYTLKADVPGVPKENVKVEVDGGTLTISADRKEEKEDKGDKYHRIERRSGATRRSVKLPQNADQDNIQATCEHGVLNVIIPKTGEKQPANRRIVVN